MPSGFRKLSFHVVDKSLDELRSVGTRGLAYRGVGKPKALDDSAVHFHTDEAAARYFLSRVMGVDDRPAVRGLAAPESAELVPDMRLSGVQEMPLTETRLVHFEQTQKSIRIFGSRVVVELDRNRELVNVTGDVAELEGVSPMPALSPAEALKQIAELADVPVESLEAVDPPELVFYHDKDQDAWYLAYFFSKVPAAAAEFLDAASKRKSHGHGMGLSPRQTRPRLNYLVDAHDGTVLRYYSAAPMIVIASKCKGVDELGNSCEFWGRKVGDSFQMHDPRRFIKTYDHKGKDLDHDPLPTEPVSRASSDWSEDNRPAVSAHVNATRVYDFYKSILLRDGIDDKGMDLVSIVNCTVAYDPHYPEWHNAYWWDNQMWYGRFKDDNGELRSYSQFLDVIAHELTHGITQYTSNLVYQDESGALNESFSDIFGVIISNWNTAGPDSDVDGWNWEMGPGLGKNGLPLRDMSDPTRTGDPDHMDDYWHTTEDNGGVHTNSNIHNKAAYNLLTARNAQGDRVFSPREVAELYYQCLCRISSLATFSDVLSELVNLAKNYWAGFEDERLEKIAHIRDAYQAVGIT